jgi:metal-responsive CopG/Arc/MetJ family transcriptional regulator
MGFCIPVGVSLPRDLVKKIDAKRLDVSRSRFLLRIIEEKLMKTDG